MGELYFPVYTETKFNFFNGLRMAVLTNFAFACSIKHEICCAANVKRKTSNEKR